MNKSFFLLLLSISFFLINPSIEVSGQSKDLRAGYYLTIATYAKNKEQYAIAYTDKVRNMGFEANYSFSPRKNQYFVYLKYFDDFKTSIRDLYQTRKNTDFNDCWVYVMKQKAVAEKTPKEDSNIGNLPIDEINNTSEENKSEDVENTHNDQSNSQNTQSDQSLQEEQVNLSKEAVEPAIQTSISSEFSATKNEAEGKYVFLNLFRGRTSKEVKGQVQVIDASNNTLIKKYDGNKLVSIKNPKNGNGNLILISDVFGYKKVQHDFNYKEPLNEEEYPYVNSIEDTLVVNFELARYTKGDIATMYNVFFFKDAAIMRPDSRYEINELVAMLKENSKIKIRIHGHTNGNAPGKIITLNNGSANFFSLSEEHKTYIGSSKNLSRERASVMKKYLIKEGINSNRITTKAWGGKARIHHKFSSQAHQNVRVEVEVIED